MDDTETQGVFALGFLSIYIQNTRPFGEEKIQQCMHAIGSKVSI